MHNAEKRTRVIEHVRYDDNGKEIGRFNVTVTSNETDDAIYLTRQWCEDAARKGNVNKYFSWGNNTGKQAYYENGDTLVKIKGYKFEKEPNGKYGVFTFTGDGVPDFRLELSL